MITTPQNVLFVIKWTEATETVYKFNPANKVDRNNSGIVQVAAGTFESCPGLMATESIKAAVQAAFGETLTLTRVSRATIASTGMALNKFYINFEAGPLPITVGFPRAMRYITTEKGNEVKLRFSQEFLRANGFCTDHMCYKRLKEDCNCSNDGGRRGGSSTQREARTVGNKATLAALERML